MYYWPLLVSTGYQVKFVGLDLLQELAVVADMALGFVSSPTISFSVCSGDMMGNNAVAEGQ